MKKLVLIAVVIVGPLLLPDGGADNAPGVATKTIVEKRIAADYGSCISLWGTCERREIPRMFAPPELLDPITTFFLKADDGSVMIVSKDRYIAAKVGDAVTSKYWRDDPY